MKKLFSIIVCGVLALTMCGCNKESDALKFKKEYEALNNSNVVLTIDANNPIKYVNFDETIEHLTNGTGVIYFGFPNCPWCRNMIPILIDKAKENNIDTIYYFNPSEIRDETNANYQKLLSVLDNYLIEDENGDKKLYVPDAYFVNNGEIVGHHLSTVESQVDPHTALTDEQVLELENIYQELFDRLK